MLFREFFNTYFIVENVLNSIPRRVLGMFSSIGELPDKEPYGFWIDRSGNFIPVGMYGHERALQDMLRKASEYMHSAGETYNPPADYETLFNDGWARVVLSPKEVYYQIRKQGTLTPSQQKILSLFRDLYDKREVLNDRAYD